MREEKVVVLDYLPHGYPGMKRIEPIIQGIGTKKFTLLELTGNKEVKLGDEIEINSKEFRVKRRLSAKNLTNFAKNHLEEIIAKLVEKNEKEIINIINKLGKITIRMHALELLPGVGKKNIQKILDERRKKPFESFKDFNERVREVDLKKSVIKRILHELEEGKREKYHIFTLP